MREPFLLVLAGIACIMLMTAGCTGTSAPAPAATPTAMVTAPLPAAPAATAAATAPPAPASTGEPWTGTWDTTWSSADGSSTVTYMSLTQSGTAVTGTYESANGTASITGSVQGTKLSGTWSENDPSGAYNGPFEFILSDDLNSFSGTWVSASEGPAALASTSQTWNGYRV